MENTLKNPFDPDEPVFFLAHGEGYIGPFRPSEIWQRLNRKELDSGSHCYRETEGAWMRICDHPLFRPLLAVPPPAPVPKAIQPPPAPTERGVPEVKWFLFQRDSQTGPYPESELKRWIRTGMVSRRAHVWRETLPDWLPVREVPGFWGEFPVPPPDEKSAPAEKRASPRKPLVAKIYLTNQKEVATGLCRDISVGGMQVLTDFLPGKPGDQVHLNVVPPEDLGLPSFVAQGMIVRLLEDGRGFSFRFTQIQPEALRSIEGYIS